LAAVALLTLLITGALEAQEPRVTLRNETEHLFVYTTFTEEEWQRRGAILWISDPAGLFERAPGSLGHVSSGGIRRQPLRARGTVAGYLMDPESAEWSLLRLTVAPGEEVLFSGEEISDRRLPADQLPALQEPILLDGRFADWESEESLGALRSGYEPVRFVRERRGERETLPISESRGWSRGGTRLEELKVVRSGSALYLFFRWADMPTRRTRLLLYLYGDSSRRPVGTLLLEPSGESRAVELYRPGSAAPRRVGNLLSRENALEAEIRLDEISISAPQFAVVSTLYRGERWYEEFPITRVELGDLLN
jgi:hypothetical protein